jgi:uncharacterized phosphosugar-binding protein
MGKNLVYIAGAFAIVIVICAITVSGSKTSKSSSSKQIVTNAIDNIQIEGDNSVTTNIWDYLRSKESDTIGDSSQDDEPQLTIILK